MFKCVMCNACEFNISRELTKIIYNEHSLFVCTKLKKKYWNSMN